MSAEQQRPTEYVGVATVAKWINVAPKTVNTYRKRYAQTGHPCPVPDAVIFEEREVAGWLPSREAEWVEWAKNRPGQGVGGGRPPKSAREGGKGASGKAPASASRG